MELHFPSPMETTHPQTIRMIIFRPAPANEEWNQGMSDAIDLDAIDWSDPIWLDFNP